MLVVTGVRSMMQVTTDTGARVTARWSVNTRKHVNNPESRSLQRVPGGPSGLHLVKRSRGSETIN